MSDQFPDFWTTIFFIISIIIAVFLTRFTYRPHGEISLLIKERINIVNDIESKFETLKILHNGMAANDKIYYVRGYIINSGNIDIEKKMVYESLSMDIEANKARILEFRVDNTRANSRATGENIVIKFDLLKAHEVFEFDSLVEYSPKNGEFTLKLSGRIKDVKIKNTFIGGFSWPLKSVRQWFFSWITFLGVFIIAVASSLGMYNMFVTNNYSSLAIFDNKYNTYVRVKENSSDHVMVTRIMPLWGGEAHSPRNEVVLRSEIYEGDRFELRPKIDTAESIVAQIMFVFSALGLYLIIKNKWINWRYRAIVRLLS